MFPDKPKADCFYLYLSLQLKLHFNKTSNLDYAKESFAVGQQAPNTNTRTYFLWEIRCHLDDLRGACFKALGDFTYLETILNPDYEEQPVLPRRRAKWLQCRGMALLEQYRLLGDPEKLEEAIRIGYESCELYGSDDPKKASVLDPLCAYLLEKYKNNRSLEVLQETRKICQQMVDLLLPNDPGWDVYAVTAIGNLAMVLLLESERETQRDPAKAIGLLDEAIDLIDSRQNLVGVDPPSQFLLLDKKCAVLEMKFKITNDLSVIDLS